MRRIAAAIADLFEDTDILSPNTPGTALWAFWLLVGIRRPWTLQGMVWCVVDAVWH